MLQPSEVQVLFGYRVRDQQLAVTVKSIVSDEQITAFSPLPDLLRGCGISLDECRAAIGDGTVVPLGASETDEFAALRMSAIPEDLTGKTVIDVGGYNGEMARLMLDRGAARVRLIDNGEWVNYGWRAPKLPEGVTYIGCDILEWQEPADVVVCGNVLYHVRDPWRFLWHLRTLCREKLILWTSCVEGTEPVWKIMDASDENNHDAYFTMFWKPTVNGLLRLLSRTGWTEITVLGAAGDHIAINAV